MKRRNFLRSAGALTLASTLPAPMVLRAATPEDYHIAGILSFSGAYGLIGNDMRKGAELAVAMRGGDCWAKKSASAGKTMKPNPSPPYKKQAGCWRKARN